jgi:NlpC/P60 family putative phage cell wall peptidase
VTELADESRARVLAEARRWLGTPYHHMADLPGVGVDCAMILVRVFCDLALVRPFDPRPYTRDWMLHRDDEKYLGVLLASAHEVEAPSPGDVMLFRIGRCYAHGGIVTKADQLTILHAYAPAACVIEEEVRRNADLAMRLAGAKFFSHWGA